MANSADPDQLASAEANWSGSTLFAKAEYNQGSAGQGLIVMIFFCLLKKNRWLFLIFIISLLCNGWSYICLVHLSFWETDFISLFRLWFCNTFSWIWASSPEMGHFCIWEQQRFILLAHLTLLLLSTTCPVLTNSVDPDQLASSEANWSGSALFVIKYVNFYQKPRSSNLTGWKLELGVAS